MTELRPNESAPGRDRPPQGTRHSPMAGATLWLGIGAFAAVFVALFFLGYLPRAEREKQVLAGESPSATAAPIVGVATAVLAPAVSTADLSGTLEALTLAPIYSRADGYVRLRRVDIGDRVKAGDVLAEIESPDLERQIQESEANHRRLQLSLRQTEAAREEAEADLRLAETTARRWDALVEGGVLAKQAGDEKIASLEARRANLAAAEAAVLAAREAVLAAQATLERNQVLMQFRTIRAPFAGVITVRNIDVGTLVSAGSGSSIQELFQLAQTDTLRVFVQVPQSLAPGIRKGLGCAVELPEYPGAAFPGEVVRTANAMDPATRTLLTEVQIANPRGQLMPGMYARVKCEVRRSQVPVLIPASAWRTSGTGPEVAVVTVDDKVAFRKVELGRDLGAQIEVLAGLQPGERVATGFGDNLREGVSVTVLAKAPEAASAKGGQ